ncbi:hypothetical protein QQF64_008337 [Cirrhinus molitorella]|uniref:VWFA domain-containing protein n=1 Tax=Cirrhinus molitorella TaxID=172907 RepID=A0ABR3M5Y4_9TELE
MDSQTVFVVLWILLSSTSTGIRLDGNGYVDIVIAISSKVPQDDKLIDKIKDMVTEGSFFLYDALDEKVYFREATILVPPEWNGTDYSKARTESFEKAKIRIDNANPYYGVEPYTNLYGECGEEGEYIHFTPEYLLNDDLIELFGSRGKVFLHEWAHMRWGVYDEYNEKQPFYHSYGLIEATRCSINLEGQFYEVTDEGSLQRCRIDSQTLLPTKECLFFPARNQITNSSMMFLPSLDPVTAFCRENEHNYEAPNLQNKKCGKATWTVIFEDSVDKDALCSLKPLESPPPPPSFKVVQQKQRVICLILDVSGSMRGSRILLQQQAVTHFLRNIIEDQASVGIVTFSTSATTLSPLTTIDSDTTRENLIKLLPKVAGGLRNMCLGLREGLQVLQEDNGDALGDQLIFLTGGVATDEIKECTPSIIQSGAIISTLALGIYTDPALIDIAIQTGGHFIIANDELTSNQLMDAFAALTLSTGDYTKEPVQPGDWKYSIQTTTLQAFTITVTSQVARDDVPPIIVKTHMSQQVSDGTKPMIVFAEVSQNYRPVINAEVWATLESETGSVHTLQLLDNGAGVVQLNPPKPPVPEEPLEVENFTRTATGESFMVTLSGPPPNFPPNRITDLSAEIQEDTVHLSWTAPGEDLDQGTAKSYEIRWSFDLKMLQNYFSNSHAVNTADVSPKEAGSIEQLSFNLSFPIQNGTTLFFAVQSEDEQNMKSETSNIAQASKILPAPKPPGISNPAMNLTVLVISLCVVTVVICFILAVTTWAVRCRNLSAESKMALTV